ncbi:MAG: helix-turn-helix domain-containing protein [Patescibacteria group bacterium]
MNQDQVLLNLIEESGLSQKESKVYLALLELGQGTINEISKITGLKRPIIYVILEGLFKRGYANEVPHCKINTYQAIDPAVISLKLQAVAKNFFDMVPVMKTLSHKSNVRPVISYYDTKEGILNAYNEVNNYSDAFFITSLSRIENFFPKILTDWKKYYKKNIIKLTSRNLISGTTEDIAIIKEFMEITDKVQGRIVPELKDYNVDFALYGNKLSIASFNKNPFLIIITSEEVVKTIMPIIELAWNMGKRIP